jgi:hypothetical protein
MEEDGKKDNRNEGRKAGRQQQVTNKIKAKIINEKIRSETGKLKGNKRRWKEDRGNKKDKVK